MEEEGMEVWEVKIEVWVGKVREREAEKISIYLPFIPIYARNMDFEEELHQFHTSKAV